MNTKIISQLARVLVSAGLLLVILDISGFFLSVAKADGPDFYKHQVFLPKNGTQQIQTLQPPSGFPYNTFNSADFFFPPYQSANDRYGLGQATAINFSELNAGWYVNWAAPINPVHPSGAVLARTIMLIVHDTGGNMCPPRNGPYPASQLSQVTPTLTGTALIDNVQLNPGALWLIGNEPDGVFNTNPIEPGLYAQLYHYFYTTIKNADPTAKIAIGAVIQASPLRLNYLDQVLAAYQSQYGESLPVDVMNVHLYRLGESPHCSSGAGLPPSHGTQAPWEDNWAVDVSLNRTYLENSLRDFRQWMADNGYRNMPLIISEFGVLPPFGFGDPGSGYDDPNTEPSFFDDMTNIFMTATDSNTGYPADGNKLVQFWAWFSTYSGQYGGDLYADSSGSALTLVGTKFRDKVAAQNQPYYDLQILPVNHFITTTNSMTLTNYYRNWGNDTVTGPSIRVALIDSLSAQTATVSTVEIEDLQKRYLDPIGELVSTWKISSSTTLTDSVPYTIVVNINPDEDDVNPQNNVFTRTVMWHTFADLAITGVQFSSGNRFIFNAPTIVTATVTVQNLGGSATSTATLQSAVNGPVGGTTVFGTNATIPALMPGDTQIVTTTFEIDQPGTYNFTADLSGNIAPVELISNNQYKKSITAAFAIYLPLVLK